MGNSGCYILRRLLAILITDPVLLRQPNVKIPIGRPLIWTAEAIKACNMADRQAGMVKIRGLQGEYILRSFLFSYKSEVSEL
jgi:hypothetical protein